MSATVKLVVCGLLASNLAACGRMNVRERDTLIGVGVGAAAGAAITGDTAGAIGGGVVGGVIGNQVGKGK